MSVYDCFLLSALKCVMDERFGAEPHMSAEKKGIYYVRRNVDRALLTDACGH